MKKILALFVISYSFLISAQPYVNWVTETGMALNTTFVDGQIINNIDGTGLNARINVNIVNNQPKIHTSISTLAMISNRNNASFTLTFLNGHADVKLSSYINLLSGEQITVSNPDNQNITITETASNGSGRMTVDGVSMTGGLPSTIIEDDEAVVTEVNNGGGTAWNASMNEVTSYTWLYNVVSGTSALEGFQLTITNPVLYASPGGVNSNLALWLKADADVIGATPATAWEDQSANNHHTTATGNPNLINNIINFNPTVDFDGNDYFNTTATSLIGSNNPYTKLAVISKSITVGSQNVISARDNNGNHAMFFNNSFSPTLFHSGGVISGPNITSGQASIIANRYGAGAPDNFSRTDGVSVVNNTTAAFIDNGTMGIGVFHNANNYIGHISEAIVFSSELTNTELQKVESYLSLKYGTTLNNGLIDYLASDGNTTMWATAGNIGYTNDIFGIGLDTLQALNQKVSKSINSGTILTIALDNDFTIANNSSSRTTSHTNNKQFLVLANNGGNTTLQTTEMDASLYNARLTREWKVDKTANFGQSVNLKFDGLGTTGNVTYYLLKDTDGDFASTYTEIGTLDANGEITGVNLSDGDYLTIGVKQIAPGGVAVDLQFWGKANKNTFTDVAGTLVASDGDATGKWGDNSSTFSDVSQNVVNNRPIFRDNASQNVNFNPVLDLDGTDFLSTSGTVKSGFNEDITCFSMHKWDGSTTSYSAVFGSREGSLPTRGWNFYISQSTGINSFWTSNNNTPPWHLVDGTPASTAPNLISITAVLGNAPKSVYEFGKLINTATNNYIQNTTNPFQVGSTGGGSFYYRGLIMEQIVYKSVLSSSQIQRINSYLALKYGVTLDQSVALDYLASDGNITMWKAADNLGYTNDIFGIGKDDLQALNQKVSKSVNSGTILTIALDNDFISANNETSRTIEHTNDKQFLMVANNGAPITTQTTEIDLSTYTRRIGREWKVDKTSNFNQTVSLKFEGMNSTSNVDFILLEDADGNFSTGTNSIGTLDQNGKITGVTLSDGMYYTIVKQLLTSPGGVSTNIKLWLKANDNGGTTSNGPITTWEDQSLQENNPTQSTSNNQPLYTTNTMNYNPSINFDGNNDYLKYSSANYTQGTVPKHAFTVASAESSSNGVLLFLGSTPASAQRNISYGLNNTSNQIIFSGNSGNAGTLNANHTYNSDQVIGSYKNATGATNYNFLLSANGETETNPTGTMNNFAPNLNGTNIIIGAKRSTGSGRNSHFDGNISEVIFYDNTSLSSTDQQKVQSYLALKYGTTLDNSTGGTSGDYLLSDASIAWDASTSPNYHNQIVGIVKDNASAFSQKQSVTIDDSLIVYINNIAPTNQANIGTINNDLSSLIIGNNGGKLKAFPPTLYESPTGIFSRFDREWKVTNTNFTNDFSLEIEWDSIGTFSLSDLRLLVDTDGDFSNATVYASPSVTFGIGSIIISGIDNSMIPLNSTRYITIGSISISTPLPIKLIDFTAEAIDNQIVELYWKTATEINNDYFEIERSKNGTDWRTISQIKGNGNSSTPISYTIMDNTPLNDISYYRLKQTDFNGKTYYLETRSVKITNKFDTQVTVFPNPLLGIITITGSEIELEQFKIYNSRGQDVTELVIEVSNNKTEIELDLLNLDAGIYYLRTTNTITKLIKL